MGSSLTWPIHMWGRIKTYVTVYFLGINIIFPRWDSEPYICALVLQIKKVSIKNSQLFWCEFNNSRNKISGCFVFNILEIQYHICTPMLFPSGIPMKLVISSWIISNFIPNPIIPNPIPNHVSIFYIQYTYLYNIYIWLECLVSPFRQAVHPRMSGSSTPGVSWSSSRSGAARRAPVPESSRYSAGRMGTEGDQPSHFYQLLEIY